jgi:hypothetical protein
VTWWRLTDKMRDAMGYDAFGNAPALVAAQDEAMLSNIPRAGGDVICDHCGLVFNRHPAVQGALWATRTCKDGIVKL